MSYILINGKNSDEIRGLLICKEPPIRNLKKELRSKKLMVEMEMKLQN